MDITHASFPLEILKIIEEVAESHFVSFDLEFSGIAGRRPGGVGGKLTLQEYYCDTKAAAEKYQILQVGLTIVKEDVKKGHYVARPYNFNLSPLTTLRERHFGRDWSYNSGAISFLMRNGFHFDRPLTQGVQYLSRLEERRARDAMIQDDEKASNIADMVLKKEDDGLVQHIRSSVKQWQESPKDKQDPYLNLPREAPGVPETLNRYQVRLTHQIVRKEYPKLKTVGMGHFVQVTNPTDEQQASEKLHQEHARETEISKAVGFRWLIEALVAGDLFAISEAYIVAGLSTVDLRGQSVRSYLESLQERLRARRRIFVGHNCFTDLVYLYRAFIGELPDTVEDFQDEIHTLFPAVVDTKHIASFGNKRWNNTSLDDVELDLRSETFPRIHVAAGYDRYQYMASSHEAGYDSLLTANIAIRLSAKMEREGTFFERDKANKTRSNSLPGTFGIEEDGYVTATESADISAEKEASLMQTLNDLVSTPITAVKAFFDTDKEPISKQSNEAVLTESGSPGESMELPDVVAVRENSKRWSDKEEIDKIKQRLSETNIFEVLEDGQAGPGENADSDLMSFSSGSSSHSAPRSLKNLDAMVKKGEIMPRWDGSNGFWHLFGNKLQVNGSREGVCRLG